MDAAALRAEFPVFRTLAYLNAGTDGPVPAAAVRAARAAIEAQAEDGRHSPHFEARFALQADLRERYAATLGCAAGDLALTTSTSEGLGLVLAGLDLGHGDEIVTSDSEHPGLLGPLLAARGRGVRVRTVPLPEVAAAVGPGTTLVACSHVSWITGELAPPELAEVDVPVVLDGAQGAGALPFDVTALGCAVDAAAGQKWLCGADGTGMLYVAPAFRERVRVAAPSYVSFEDANQGLDSPLREDARRYDTPSRSRESAAFSLASADLLADPAVREHAVVMAARLAERLAERGATVAPRGPSTLVSWEDADPAATRERLAAAGVIVRDVPHRPLLRASVGAWNDERDFERLLSAAGR
jgi:L-cysteine/cystine lyase